MKKKRAIFLLFIILLLSFCTKNNREEQYTENKKFIKTLKKSTHQKTILAIDSVLKINKNKELLAYLYYEKGKLLAKIQDHSKAVKYFEKALVIFKKDNNTPLLMDAYWNIGSSNTFISNTKLATKQLLIALDYSQQLEDKKIESNVYSSLAHTYYLYQDYEKAINYTLKAIEIQNEENDSIGLSATYNNLAVIYKNTGAFNNALKYNLKSLEINKHFKDYNAIAKSYNNLGLVSEMIGDYKSAISYFKKAIELNVENERLNSAPLRNLASYFFKTNQLDSSKYYYLKALTIENFKENNNIKKDIYNILLNISIKNKDFESSLKYQTQRDSITSELSTLENLEKLELLENQYQLAVSEKDLKQEKSINKKNKIIFGIITLFAFLLSMYWFQSIRNKKLKEEKKKISLEQKVLRSQMNPHFIFNALSSIQNSLLDNEPIKSATYLSRFAKLIRQNFDFINEKTILLKDEIDALQNYMDTQKMRFNNKFDYEINVSETVDIYLVEIPPLLIQPFVENAIEHGFKNKKDKGKLSINISKVGNITCYEIKDNGKGFETIKNDTKIHSIDIFKKRLKLLGKKEEQSLKIKTSEKGTSIKFCLKI